MTNEIEMEDDVKAIPVLIAALKPLSDESRVHVLEFVLKKLGITLSGHAPAQSNSQLSAIVPATQMPFVSQATPPSGVHDIRSFAFEKKPKTVNEKVAVIGYYLAQLAPDGERRDHLVADDIKTYFIQAGFELPTAPPGMTLSHAKNAGYLNAMERGQYRLNAVGHNLVAHKLPGADGSESRRRSARKKAKK